VARLLVVRVQLGHSREMMIGLRTKAALDAPGRQLAVAVGGVSGGAAAALVFAGDRALRDDALELMARQRQLSSVGRFDEVVAALESIDLLADNSSAVFQFEDIAAAGRQRRPSQD
jgi:hypothetical protein